MAIAYVSSGALSSANSGSSSTPALPASISAGNILFLVANCTAARTIAVPSGWTLFQDQVDASGNHCALMYKVASGSDSSPTVTFSGSCRYDVQIHQFSGGTVIGASNFNTGIGTTHSCTGITSTAADSAAIYFDSSTNAMSGFLNPAGWTSDSNSYIYGSIAVGHKILGVSGDLSGDISTINNASGFGLWIIELKAPTPPIDAPAESTSTASTETIAGYGIAAPAESTAAATAETSYIFAIGAFGSSSASLTSIANRIFYGSGVVSSSAVVTGTASLIWEANVIVEAIASVVGAVIGTRNTSGSAESSAIVSDLIHGFFILDASASSSGEFTSTADILRSLGAAASSAAVVSGNANVRASYYLLAESIATIIDGVQFVNDYWDGWTYNLNIEAPSFYENFKFNSFAKLGQNYYGMASDGIHLLSGENDNGVDINSLIKTGSDDYDDSTIKTIPTIYASARSDKEMILNAKVDDNPAYDYTFIGKPGEIAPIRVKLGRGLRGKMWTIEVRNKDGAFIEIDQLDIPSVSTSRKV